MRGAETAYDYSGQENYDEVREEQLKEVERQLLSHEYGGNYEGRRRLMESLPEDRRERIHFVENNIDISNPCPSTGMAISQSEAFMLYNDYRDYEARLNPDDRSTGKVAVLCDIEDMLNEKISIASKTGDSELVDSYGRLLAMISDQEALASKSIYYTLGEECRTKGSRIDMVAYIKGVIEIEGYSGTKQMHEANPDSVGGVLRLEYNLKLMDKLLENSREGADGVIKDEPIKLVAETIKNEDLSKIDWNFLMQFSSRGVELFNYATLFRNAESHIRRAESFKEKADKHPNETLLEYAKREKQAFDDIKAILKRTPDDFAKDILHVGQEGVPEIPQDVQDYLFRNYGYDGEVLLSNGDATISPLAKIYMKLIANQMIIANWAKRYKSAYPNNFFIDLNDYRYIEDENNSYQVEADYIGSRILPVLEATMRALGDTIPSLEVPQQDSDVKSAA